MKPSAAKKWFKSGFIVCAVVGFIFNAIFDLVAYNENLISNEVEKNIIQSYELQLKFKKLKSLLFDSSNANYALVNSAFLEIDKNRLNSSDAELLNELEAYLNGDHQKALTIVEKLYAQQSNLLSTALSSDRLHDNKIEITMLRALLLDCGLILVLLALFLLEVKAKLKTERGLKSSLASMRKTLSSVEEENFRTKSSVKTTVHDLKNPLGTILGFAQILKEEADSNSSIAEFADRIQKISKRSLELVESILREENAPFELTPVNLETVIKDICSQLEVQAYSKKQKINTLLNSNEAYVLGNSMKIEELLSNLIGNAIKYSPTRSQIEVRSFSTGATVKVEIEDQGPGFTMDDKQRAFKYGQKLTAQPTGGESSTGFGLFIAKQIVEFHKGHIAITDSQSENGACITFEIPILQSPQSRV